MGQIGGHTGGVDDIVEGELVDERGCLEEKRERLSWRLARDNSELGTLERRVPGRCHRTLLRRLQKRFSGRFPGAQRALRSPTCFDHGDGSGVWDGGGWGTGMQSARLVVCKSGRRGWAYVSAMEKLT